MNKLGIGCRLAVDRSERKAWAFEGETFNNLLNVLGNNPAATVIGAALADEPTQAMLAVMAYPALQGAAGD
jgi:hypothetical protein